MLSTSQVAVKAKWDSYTYPVLPGTPLGANGAVANTSSAVGIVMERIDKKPDNPDEELSIMVGGIVDKAELWYDLSAAAVKALNGIVFRGYDVDPLPPVTAEDNGKVLGVADGAWTKVAGGGTGGGDVYVVTFMGTAPTGGSTEYTDVTANHTLEEAMAAYDAGKLVIFELGESESDWHGLQCIAFNDGDYLAGIAWSYASRYPGSNQCTFSAVKYYLETEGPSMEDFMCVVNSVT